MQATAPAGQWLYQADDKYYVNLPPRDNWSESYPLVTTWQKLRIHSAVARGSRTSTLTTQAQSTNVQPHLVHVTLLLWA